MKKIDTYHSPVQVVLNSLRPIAFDKSQSVLSKYPI